MKPFRTPHSAFRTPQSGVALVVTLIMLSVITFMAISFLVLSRAEHGSVSTETDQATAKYAAEYGLQRAINQTLAPIMAQTNEFRYDLLVSTNYINPLGFFPGIVSPTNVNYDFVAGSSLPLNPLQRAQNIANLWIDPRPPVFITNRFSALGGFEFRYFNNLNRNTNIVGPVFDPTGWLPVVNLGLPVVDPVTGIPLTNFFVGDPQWIGILESPDRPHAADNRFVGRYAYLVVPAGKTLDFNYIYNDAKQNLGLASGDGFLRNQGAGSYEGNLAAFLVDLNSNFWPYQAQPPAPYPAVQLYAYDTNAPSGVVANQGTAFEDASALLRFRYAYSPASLSSVSSLYGNAGVSAFSHDYIDCYVSGPVNWISWPPQNGPLVIPDPDTGPGPRVTQPWCGAPNTNHFFTPQEFFDPNKVRTLVFGQKPFTARLLEAGNNIGTPNGSSYDEYTFYRLLSGLGSDSAGDASRINLNYCNFDNRGNMVPNMATNFIPWIPEQFFTNTANLLLLKYGYNFTVTNIQIYPTNFYTPSVHRLLQLAANIYDAGTNHLGTNNLPTVFRPFFRLTPDGRVLIAGYREVQNDNVAIFSNANGTPTPTVILGYNQNSLPSYVYGQFLDPLDVTEPMVTGIPLVIGVKKGLPNFNEFAMDTKVEFGRKLRFVKGGTGAITQTNAMFLLNLTNTFGFEAWNSYLSAYPRNLEVRMDAVLYALLTTSTNFTPANNLLRTPGGGLGDLSDPIATRIYRPAPTTIPAYNWLGWQGYTDPTPSRSFRAVTQNYSWTNAQYNLGLNALVPLPGAWDSPNITIPQSLYLSLRGMVRFALVDTSVNPRRIIDYVSLDYATTPTNLVTLIKSGANCGSPTTTGPITPGSLWCENLYNGVPVGVFNQIQVNLGLVDDPDWPSAAHHQDIDYFRAQLIGQNSALYPEDANATYSLTNTFYTAYGGERPIYYHLPWQVNDPLVHYTVADLRDLLAFKGEYDLDTDNSPAMAELGGLNFSNGLPVGATAPLNGHFRPWGTRPRDTSDTTPPTNWRLEVKDPLVTRSDAWDFPTNKYPNIGWLGRVHRGTPWQTIYLKSTTNSLATWQLWSGNTNIVVNYDGNNSVAFDAVFSMPENDRPLLDWFSTAFNDNAARGRMSVNQENLAAWSAILAGVVVRTNTIPDQYLVSVSAAPQQAPFVVQPQPTVIPPAGQFDPFQPDLWPQMVRIVKGINRTRLNHWDYTAGHWTNTFEHLGDILAVPELTVASPFLRTNGLVNPFARPLPLQSTVGLSDADYERIPQQILGLLQCDHTPRLVIYAYGQALKPAERSVITSGPYFGLCTNYQITAEVTTRAVVRLEGAPTHPHAVIESFNVVPAD